MNSVFGMTATQANLTQATLRLGGDGIARYVARPDADITLADAEEVHEAATNLYAGSTYPLLVDIRGVRSASREARESFASTKTINTTSAVALVVASPVSRIIGNFFIQLDKPAFPVQLFTRETDAIAWLQDFIE